MSVTIIRPNGETLTLDSSPEQSWAPANEVVTHPIEDRTQIADHVERQPLMLSIPCRITETPLGPGADAVGPGLGEDLVGPERIEEALRFLNAAGDGAELLEVETRLGSVDNLILKDWPYDVTQLQGLGLVLEFQQVRLADVQVVRLPREVPRVEVQDTAPGKEDVGRQPSKKASQSDEQVVRSRLRSGGDGARDASNPLEAIQAGLSGLIGGG